MTSENQKSIVGYDIEMLNVKSADAFILRYQLESEDYSHIILVDCGNVGDGEKVIDYLKKYNDNPVVDIAIVTHPDKDHFGGFITMLNHIMANDERAIRIKRFWLNDPQNNHISPYDVKYKRTQEGVNASAASIWDVDGYNLVDLIDECGIPTCEKFARCLIKKNIYGQDILIPANESSVFPGCTIIGPTKEFFEELAPNMRFDNMESIKNNIDNFDLVKIIDSNNDSLSLTMDETTDDDSPHNQSSLIFLWEPQNDVKYLFMGDACYKSFSNIPDAHKKLLSNVTWLKVPHHGSKHNLCTEMIKCFNPSVAYISSKKPYKCVVNALKKNGTDVYSTHHCGESILHNMQDNREGYEAAEKL